MFRCSNQVQTPKRDHHHSNRASFTACIIMIVSYARRSQGGEARMTEPTKRSSGAVHVQKINVGPKESQMHFYIINNVQKRGR